MTGGRNKRMRVGGWKRGGERGKGAFTLGNFMGGVTWLLGPDGGPILTETREENERSTH